jgi:hypothetical protein
MSYSFLFIYRNLQLTLCICTEIESCNKIFTKRSQHEEIIINFFDFVSIFIF